MRFTNEQDQKIKELYQRPYVRGKIAKQARQWNCKCSDITHRRKQLGLKTLLQRKPVKRWSEAEIRIIRQNSHLTHEQVSDILNAAGYDRTEQGVSCFRFRDGWRASWERDEINAGYTTHNVAEILGVWNTTVLRWIRLGWLKAHSEGGAERCSTYRVNSSDLYTFLITHVHYWNPAKVDKYWLIDFLTQKR